MKKSNISGFTLIELLVVISIISLLSSIVLASLNTARLKARDAKRLEEINQIYISLQLYFDRFGYLPSTSSYGESNCGGWDYSSQSGSCGTAGTNFLTFLKTTGIMPNVPVDPINNSLDDGATGYAYYYFCYSANNTMTLGSILENYGGVRFRKDKVTNEPGYVCKDINPALGY